MRRFGSFEEVMGNKKFKWFLVSEVFFYLLLARHPRYVSQKMITLLRVLKYLWFLPLLDRMLYPQPLDMYDVFDLDRDSRLLPLWRWVLLLEFPFALLVLFDYLFFLGLYERISCSNFEFFTVFIFPFTGRLLSRHLWGRVFFIQYFGASPFPRRSIVANPFDSFVLQIPILIILMVTTLVKDYF